MANEHLSTIKAKIDAAQTIPGPSVSSNTLTAKETALQAAIAAKTAAEVARDNAIALRDQAVTLKNTAIAQRDNALASVSDEAYYAALEEKNATITDLTTRLNAANAAAIAAEHTALEAYKAKDISLATVSAISAQTATGSAITPTPTITLGGVTLTKDTHYTLAYANNTAVGTATITITGISPYFYTKSVNFAIQSVTSE